mmetsp:Transcript_10876/g.26306  ORF Transcript_10876/g.26306 Transcript_10876/m.26306 type:complete len:220 (-) Transcript_10876:480-1139(-)
MGVSFFFGSVEVTVSTSIGDESSLGPFFSVGGTFVLAGLLTTVEGVGFGATAGCGGTSMSILSNSFCLFRAALGGAVVVGLAASLAPSCLGALIGLGSGAVGLETVATSLVVGVVDLSLVTAALTSGLVRFSTLPAVRPEGVSFAIGSAFDTAGVTICGLVAERAALDTSVGLVTCFFTVSNFSSCLGSSFFTTGALVAMLIAFSGFLLVEGGLGASFF